MLKELIWKDPKSDESLHYNQKKQEFTSPKGASYSIDKDGIIDFIPNEKINVKGAASPFTRRLKNGLSSDEKIRSSYLQFLEIWPQDFVLEVSVGKADNIKYLSDLTKSAKFVGVDTDLTRLKKAANFDKTDEMPLTLVHAHAEALPFMDNTFGCVYHDDEQTAFENLSQAVKEMVRVAKPNAKIMLTSKRDITEVKAALPTSVRDIQVQEVRKGKYQVLTCYKK